MDWVIRGELAKSQRPGYVSGGGSVDADVIDEWIKEVKEEGIKSVICLLDDDQLERFYNGTLLDRYRENGLKVGHVPIKDHRNPPVTPEQSEQALHDYRSLTKPVLIHCSACVDRTPYVVAHICRKTVGIVVFDLMETLFEEGKGKAFERMPDLLKALSGKGWELHLTTANLAPDAERKLRAGGYDVLIPEDRRHCFCDGPEARAHALSRLLELDPKELVYVDDNLDCLKSGAVQELRDRDGRLVLKWFYGFSGDGEKPKPSSLRIEHKIDRNAVIDVAIDVDALANQMDVEWPHESATTVKDGVITTDEGLHAPESLVQTPPVQTPPPVCGPTSELLKGRHEICAALNIGVDKWRWLQRLSKGDTESPIVSAKSKPPTVRKAALLTWWGKVEARQQELTHRQESRNLNGQEKPHGRDEKVIYDGEARAGAKAGIHVKKRRASRS